MAKKVLTYSDFKKGLVTYKNARDITKDSLPDGNGNMFDEGGQIRPMGSLVLSGDVSTAAAFNKGYGAFAFRSDYSLGGVATAGGVTIFAYIDDDVGSTSKLFLVDDVTPTTISWDLGASNVGANASFYYVDGALRVSDSVIGNTANYVWWFGYVSHEYFDHTISGWKNLKNDLPAPTASVASDNPAYGSAGVSISLVVSQTTTDGGEKGAWEDETYEFAVSWVYLGDQESKLFTSTGTLAMNNKQQMIVNMRIKEDSAVDGSGGNTNTPRLIGARAYTRLSGTDDNWMLIIDANLDDGAGIRNSIYNPTYTAWTESTGDWTGVANIQHKAPPALDYEILNGHRSGDVGRLAFGGNSAYNWKTATTGRGRAWVANVNYVKDQYNATTAMNDRILFSAVGKYDLFPSNYWLDLGINDGDEIIKIAYNNSNLFVWKESVLYVVDISGQSQDTWKIKQTLTGMGVASPSSVIDFEDGIAWANETGCFLYTEKGVERLTMDISLSEWSAFVEPANCVIGYIPVERQIIVLGSHTTYSGTDGEVYVYDRNTETWSKGIMSPYGITNMFIQDNLLYTQAIDSGVLKTYKWVSGTHTNNQTIFTKDEDFGQVGIFKKVYSVIVTYKMTNSTYDYLRLQYGTDGASPSSNFGSPTQLTDDSDWRRVVFTATSPIKSQSIRFKLSTTQSNGTTASNSPLWINDISIEYRMLSGAIIDAP